MTINKQDMKILVSIKAVFDRENKWREEARYRYEHFGDDDIMLYDDMSDMFNQVVGERAKLLSDKFKKVTGKDISWGAIEGYAKSNCRSDEDNDNYRFWTGDEILTLQYVLLDEWLRTGKTKPVSSKNQAV